MSDVLFITHPEVVVDPATPIERWGLSDRGVARMQAFAASAEVTHVREVWASGETKAREAAALLAERLRLAVQVEPELGENDRSATGFLPPDEFERTADAFFAKPEESVRGWETAKAAQARIVRAVERILARPHLEGDIAIVAHGAVGTLLLCATLGRPITRDLDQPFQGHFWRFDAGTMEVRHPWRPIAPR